MFTGPLKSTLVVESCEVSTALGTAVQHFHFDELPQSGEVTELLFGGWTFGRHEKQVGVRVECDGETVLESDLIGRPDVREHFGNHPNAVHVGFRLAVNALALPRKGTLTLLSVGAGARATPLCSLRYRLAFGALELMNPLAPVMVCSVGRSGSTLLMRGLAAHPEFAVHPRHPHEMRYFQYCVHAARVLAVNGILPSMHPESDFHKDALRVGPCPFFGKSAELDAWLRARHHGWVLRSWLEQGHRFYREMCGNPQAKLLAEKCDAPNLDLYTLSNLGLGLRTIALVRDPRDVVVSWLKFNKRRRDAVATMEWTEFEWNVGHIALDFRRLVHRVRDEELRPFVLRYEDLVSRSGEVMGPLLAYCGADAGEAALERVLGAMASDDEELRAHRTTDSVQASMGSWRWALSGPQRELCEGLLGDAIAALEYDGEGESGPTYAEYI